jgi:hypothetical protein
MIKNAAEARLIQIDEAIALLLGLYRHARKHHPHQSFPDHLSGAPSTL